MRAAADDGSVGGHPAAVPDSAMAEIQRRLSESLEALEMVTSGVHAPHAANGDADGACDDDDDEDDVPPEVAATGIGGVGGAGGEAASDEELEGSEEDDKLRDIDVTYADLRLRDGIHRPYPYLLDTRRIYSYTKMRFYRKGSLQNYVGEICLFGATLKRPDPNRPIIHLQVPNFTYYLHARSRDEEASLVLRLEKWIQVANVPYTNRSAVFLTVSVQFADKDVRTPADGGDAALLSFSAAGAASTAPVGALGSGGGGGGSGLAAALGSGTVPVAPPYLPPSGAGGGLGGGGGYVKEGAVRVTGLAQRTWALSAQTRYSVVYLELLTDIHQEVSFTFVHTQLGVLAHAPALRLRDIIGHHLNTSNGSLHVPLLERSRKRAGTMVIAWDIAPERYLKLQLSGSNIWRKDFVRPDPFFRVKRHGAKGATTTVYRSEAYKNLAHPSFLPLQLSIPPAYVVKAGRRGRRQYVLVSCAPEKGDAGANKKGPHDPCGTLNSTAGLASSTGGGGVVGGGPGGKKGDGDEGDSLEDHVVDWVGEIVSAGEDKSDENRKKLNLLRVMDTEHKGKGGGRRAAQDTEGSEAAEVTRRVVEEIARAKQAKRSINDNDVAWSAVSLSDTLTVELWDNNMSRARRLTNPSLIGTLELTLHSVLGDINLQAEPCGELSKTTATFRLLRSARYNDDEPPASEVQRGHSLLTAELAGSGRRAGGLLLSGRQGRGGDCTNAQSTVLPTPEARARQLESKMRLASASLNERPSFLHFIKGKWCVELAVCIDFTQGSHQHHKQSRIVPSWNIFQMLITHCMSFLGPFTGRGGADLYGFAGVQPSAEYQVFPIHKHANTVMHSGTQRDAEDATMCNASSSASTPTQSGRHRGRKMGGEGAGGHESDEEDGEDEGGRNVNVASLEGVIEGDHATTDLTGTALQLGYSRAKEQMSRLFDTTLPIFLLPVIRTAAARVREINHKRADTVAATTERFFRELAEHRAATGGTASDLGGVPLSLLQMASFLDKEPLHTFGVGIIMIGSTQDIGDLDEAVTELREMERAKLPFLFFLLFIDCTAPPAFVSLLNCITVDIDSSPLLIQASLHLLARGLGLFPARFIDYMRLHSIEPDPPASRYMSHFYAGDDHPPGTPCAAGTAASSTGGDAQHIDEEMAASPLAAATATTPAAAYGDATVHEPAPRQGEEEAGEEEEEEAEAAAAATAAAAGSPGGGSPRRRPVVGRLSPGYARSRTEFRDTSAKFLQIFSDHQKDGGGAGGGEDGRRMDDEAAMHEAAERGFPLSDDDAALDKRYKKAVSTKGHEVFAIVSDRGGSAGRHPRGRPPPAAAVPQTPDAPGMGGSAGPGRDLKIIDLYMADDQLARKEKADARLREYLSEKNSRRRRSSGLAQAHSRLLRLREEETEQLGDSREDAAANEPGTKPPPRQASGRGALRALTTMVAKTRKGGGGTGGAGGGAGGAGAKKLDFRYDSSSSDSTESDGQTAYPKRIAARSFNNNLRKAARLASQADTRARRASQGVNDDDDGRDSDEGSESESVQLRRFLATEPIDGYTGQRLRPRKREAQVTWYAYEGKRAGNVEPISREFDMQREYRTLGKGLKVDWCLDKSKQTELRRIMRESVQLHAGPQLEKGQTRQDMQDELRRVSSLASLQPTYSSGNVFHAQTPHAPHGARPSTGQGKRPHTHR